MIPVAVMVAVLIIGVAVFALAWKVIVVVVFAGISGKAKEAPGFSVGWVTPLIVTEFGTKVTPVGSTSVNVTPVNGVFPVFRAKTV